jgi:hypothetical protein
VTPTRPLDETATLLPAQVTLAERETNHIEASAVLTPTRTMTPTVSLTTTASIQVAITPTPPLMPTRSPPPGLPGAAHIAVLIGETVIAVGGTGSSEVFVSFADVQPGVQGFELHLSYDPQIVHVLDADGEPANGVQIAAATFFAGGQRVDTNQADNETGRIILALTQADGAALSSTDTWEKVATVTWSAQAEGKSVVAMDGATLFRTADEQLVAPDAVSDGVVFARAPGVIQGSISLEGRVDHRNVLVSGTLAAGRVDKGHSDASGHFEIVISHGEGFYTLVAAMPGYLSAESERPVQVIVDSVTHVGQVTLLGGDVNGDNCIDVRDLSYVAWHFDEYAPNADVNGDELVDILDLSLMATNFGQCGPVPWPIPD